MFHVLQKDFIFPGSTSFSFIFTFTMDIIQKNCSINMKISQNPLRHLNCILSSELNSSIQHVTCLSSLESVFWGIPCWSSVLEHGVFTAGAQVPFLVRELRSFKLGVMVKESGVRWGVFLTYSSMFIRKMGLPRWHQR